MAIEVSDARSNANEQILWAVETIGRSVDRRLVFEAIYYHKSEKKTVAQIAERTGLKPMRVLQEGRLLADRHIVEQVKTKEGTAYKPVRFYQSNKRKILSLVGKPQKAAKIPTKRSRTVIHMKTKAVPAALPRAEQITIDDIDSFARVKGVRRAGPSLPRSMSEDSFKNGVQAIVGEPGKFTDWGGETSDLFSTRLKLKGKRRAVAFGFKGPGVSGPLVPARMGKNGDQMQRLFKEPAQVFLVQHWREIKPSVLDMMRAFAVDKAVSTGKPIFYGIIDGHDSERIRLAYRSKFSSF